MKQKQFIVFFSLCLLLLNMSKISSICFAQSEVQIEFTEGNEVIPPVDPDNPSNLLQPPGTGTGQTGPLTLNYASPLNFGSHPVSATTQTYPAETLKPFIQVTDLRGTGAGWKVEAVASTFQQNGENTLVGSVIKLNGGFSLSANPELTAPVPAATITLPTDGLTSARIVTASSNQGLGTWVTRWYPTTPDATKNNNVTIEIPGGSGRVGAHTGSITWNLINSV